MSNVKTSEEIDFIPKNGRFVGKNDCFFFLTLSVYEHIIVAKQPMFLNNGMILTEQNLRLAAAYQKMNETGRDVLDKAIQKLTEKQLGLEEIKRLTLSGELKKRAKP